MFWIDKLLTSKIEVEEDKNGSDDLEEKSDKEEKFD